MNTLRIILKEFKLALRDFKGNLMMIAFPIVLIIILGAAFSGTFDNTIDLGDVTVLYTEGANSDGQGLTAAFRSFREEISKELGVTFEKADDENAGREAVKDYKNQAYIHVSDTTGEIKLYKNERYNFTSSLLESALNSFANTYEAVSVIAINSPETLTQPEMFEQRDFVEVKALDKKMQPGSMDYYAVAMMTMILLYSSITGFWSIRRDVEQKTAPRILCAPVRKHEMLIGNIAGSIFITVVQGTVVILFSKFILKAYWGEDLLTIALLLLTYSIMAVSLGAGLAFMFKSSNAASGVLNTIIPIFVFLGGGYVPLGVINGPMVGILSDISPVKWANTALFGMIYNHDYSRVGTSIAINLGMAIVFITISALFAKKEGKLYA